MIPVWFKGSLLLAATLSAGIAIGVWFERSHGHAPAMPHAAHSYVMQRLHHSLDLDSSQHVAISATLQRHQAQVDSVWMELQPHVRATLDSTHAEIMNLLRPHQREQFRHIVRMAHPESHR